METLTIGRVARSAGLGIETVRFYEKEGLLDPPRRTRSNYRIYSDQAVARLRFIKRAKALGFTLKEIKELLDLSQDPTARMSDIKDQVEIKIADIKRKITDLSRIQRVLETLDAGCDGRGSTDGCPILHALEDGDDLIDENLSPGRSDGA
jgi:Hg(II)-responsive transcriptional regulator